MLKRIHDVKDKVFCIRLDDNIYTLAQCRGNTYYEFFDIFFTKPEEKRFPVVDLNTVDVLMTLSCATNRFKNFFLRAEKKVIPNQRPLQNMFLTIGHMVMVNAFNDAPNKMPLEVSLIRTDVLTNSLAYEVIIEKVDGIADQEIIDKYQFSGMIGDSEELREQLLRYVQEGILWGADKEHSFPEAKPRVRPKPPIIPFAQLLECK